METGRASSQPAEGTEVLRRYVLQALLGCGGCGEVWRALDTLTQQRVAVKLLRAGDDERAAARREVAALRMLLTPGVARLIDEGLDAVGPVVVMELIDGAPFPGPDRSPAVVAEVTAQLLRVLADVHALGVVHRDLKPANVLVTADGRPVVLDFGLALGGTLSHDPRSEGLVGTPAWLAPEQIDGRAVDARTDLYAVGLMLFEALTGAMPVPVEPSLGRALAARVDEDTPPVRTRAPALPDGLARLIDRVLQRDPDARPASAADALAVLLGDDDRPRVGPQLPRLGDRAPLDAALDRCLRGLAVDVVGPRGSGRTRLLEDLADALVAHGRTVLRAAPGRLPWESLDALAPSPPDARSDALRAALSSGAVLLVDAVSLDAQTASLVDALPDVFPVVRVRTEAAQRAHVELAPLSVHDLRGLIVGPERLLHIPGDAADALLRATGGLAGRVVDELDAWVRAGLARRVDGRVSVTADDLHTLALGLRPAVARRTYGLPGSRAPLLEWISLAWPQTRIDLLARALRRSPDEIDREVRMFESRGLVRLLNDGRVEPISPAAPTARAPWITAAHIALADALPPGTPGRLFHLVSAARGTPAPRACARIAEEVSTLASERMQVGSYAAAAAVIAAGLRALRDLFARDVYADAEGELLTLWVKAAFADVSPRAVDRVAYELCRVNAPSPRVSQLLALVEAALTARTDGARALDAVDRIAPFECPELEWWRHAVRMLAARRTSHEREEAALASVESWAAARDDERARRGALAWRGRLLYRSGRFAEAARCHADAAAGEGDVTRRLGALTSAASGWLEAFCLDDAAQAAREAHELAAGVRHAYFEARAAWLLRAVAYRRRERPTVDRELIEAVGWLAEPDVQALVSVTEAAFAWRAGDDGLAQHLAAQAHRLWLRGGMGPAADLARCLAIVAGAPCESHEFVTLAASAARCPLPRVGAQCLGLLGRVVPAVVRPHARTLAAVVEATAPQHRDVPLEVISLHEAWMAVEPRAMAH